MTSTSTATHFTSKGHATRAHIVAVAARLMFERGVAGTSVEDVYKAAGASSSQIYHYFGDRQGLIRAVVRHQAAAVIELQQPLLGKLDTLEALRAWADFHIEIQKRRESVGGCAFGALASQLNEQEPDTRADLAAGFERWAQPISDGLRQMQRRGEIPSEVDTDRIGVSMVAALQGGLLLTQTQRSPVPLEMVLNTMVDHVALLRATRSASSAGARADGPLTLDTPRVIFEVETTLPTAYGAFRVRAYRDVATGAEHLAIVSGEPTDGALVRVHSECLTGEVFASEKCECGPQLDASLREIQARGGVVIYMRGHEGRGIGLINKLKAYRLQEEGLDTLDANTALGFPADDRDYQAAVAILDDLGIAEIRAMTNNPDKIRQLRAGGIVVREQVPLVVGAGVHNESYLATKRDRMGHALPEVVAPAP